MEHIPVDQQAAKRGQAQEQCQRDKAALAASQPPEDEGGAQSGQDADHKGQHNDAHNGKRRDARAAARAAENGNDREEYDNADDIINGCEWDERLGHRAAGVVFIDDGKRGRGRSRQRDTAEEKRHIHRHARHRKDGGEHGGHQQKRTNRLYEGDADDLLAR